MAYQPEAALVVYIPPHWSLGGPGPATARDGGYRTGHIRDSLLPHTAEQWKPLNPEEKKRYDREFLLGFQFIFASMQKPEGLPQITDVVLDKVGAALEIGGAWVVPRWGSGSSLCLVEAGQGLNCCARGPVAAFATSLEPGVGAGGALLGPSFQFLVPALRLGDGSIPLLCPPGILSRVYLRRPTRPHCGRSTPSASVA